ncbi:uncharacterized protein LOC111707406 [Eurytemora carolleeae]|uniref:uncharacterized protein LOC111707406 n=1 Tax=Eurytemora carolleeae TaxID=1294199 RepID=UPI000C77F851|nr:uncharacterized protein LOC111707406 [Eurytemora carolleeae]|eukprot:XP_023336278.1 uncharacterized protein LOC111707406 [Eurytemora affinis]
MELYREKLLECTHSLINVCHYSYITSFKPNREEECEDHYEKICNIVFVPQASDEIIEHCYKPMVKNCNNVEPDAEDEICKDMHETECSTRYEKKGDKFVANTECKKIPLTLCGSRSCRFEEGEEECHNKTTASISTVPEESCDLVPQKTCKGVYKLVPFLQPTHQCKDVPREICTFGILSSKLGTAPLD